jgi:cyanophycinase-like exopeptidase
MQKKYLFLCLLLTCHALSGQTYTSFFTGDTSNVNVPTKGGVVLMGGATESDDAMRWFLQQATGGDVVVIRASGSNGYNNYLYTQLGVSVNSVESIVVKSDAAAFDPYVARRIREADALWIAGGDQANYVNFWKDSPVQAAINYLILEKKAVIGGTSAGMAVLGGAYFSALNGSVTSTEALANPYNTFMRIGYGDFINYPLLKNVICDTHFDNPDRKGRLVTFLSRLIKDQTVARPLGIACEEFVAVCVDSSGLGRVFGLAGKSAYFVQPNCELAANTPENCASGQNLTWNRNGEALKVYVAAANTEGSATFDLRDWRTGKGGIWQNWAVVNGVFKTPTNAQNPPNCAATTPVFAPSFSPLTLFPNPTSGFIHVANVEGLTEDVIFEIYNINGILIQRKTVINKTLTLYVKDLPPSVYWLVLRGKDGIRAAKFSKL